MTQITIDRSGLMRGLSQIARTVERRTTIPVLANVKLEAIGRSLTITGTDLDIEVQTVLDCDVSGEGAITAPAHLLHDLVRKVTDGPVALSWSDPPTMTLKAGRSRFSLQTIPASDYPDLSRGEQPVQFSLPANALADIVSHTEFAVSTEETRYYLNGIYLHAISDGNASFLRGVATDGHRLAQYQVECPQGAAEMQSIIIPRKAISEIARLLKDHTGLVDVAMSPAKITLTVGATRLTSKLIDGTFPDYSRVIPRESPVISTLLRTELQGAVDRVGTLSSANGRAMKFTFSNNGLKLSVVNPDAGASEEEVECVVAGMDGEEFEIGFNGRYMLDMLAVLTGETVTFAMRDNRSPALVRANDAPDMLAVIMPMRV